MWNLIWFFMDFSQPFNAEVFGRWSSLFSLFSLLFFFFFYFLFYSSFEFIVVILLGNLFFNPPCVCFLYVQYCWFLVSTISPTLKFISTMFQNLTLDSGFCYTNASLSFLLQYKIAWHAPSLHRIIQLSRQRLMLKYTCSNMLSMQ